MSRRVRNGHGGARTRSDFLGDAQDSLPQDAPEIRERLLKAARAEFAAKGYDGASLRSIANGALANIGAINYHYESKENLYLQVLAQLVGPLGARIEFAAHRQGTGLERAVAVVRVFFEHIRQHPDMPPIVAREMASGHDVAAPLAGMMGRGLKALSGCITDGQADGSIRAGDPILLTLSCVSQPVYLNLARRAIKTVAGVNIDDERVTEHAIGVIEAFLRA